MNDTTHAPVPAVAPEVLIHNQYNENRQLNMNGTYPHRCQSVSRHCNVSVNCPVEKNGRTDLRNIMSLVGVVEDRTRVRVSGFGTGYCKHWSPSTNKHATEPG